MPAAQIKLIFFPALQQADLTERMSNIREALVPANTLLVSVKRAYTQLF